MNFPGDCTNMAADAASSFENQADSLRIQWWPSESLAAFSSDFQTGQRPFFDQGPLKLGDGHQHAELKLTNRVPHQSMGPIHVSRFDPIGPAAGFRSPDFR